MAQTSFQLDDGTAKAIDELKGVFGVATSTSVIRKAVALARIVSRMSADGAITMLDKDDQPTKVLLVG